MFKLVVLSVVFAVACAHPNPGFLGGYAIPAATSYSSRIDVHSKPIITTYAHPVHYGVKSYGLHAPLVADYGLGYGYGGYGIGYGGYGIGHEGYGLGHGY